MVEIKAEVPAVQDVSELIPAVTVAICVNSPFSADCTSDVFDATRMASSTECGNDDQHATCGQVIIAEIPAVQDVSELVPAVTVATCIGNPFASGCNTL